MIKRCTGDHCLVVDLDTIRLTDKEKQIELSKESFEELIEWYIFGKEHWKEKTKEYKIKKGMV